MKKMLTMILALGVAFLFTSSVWAAGAGCCSGHKGVCECKCCDGTALSDKCMKKECEAVAKTADKAEKKADTTADKAEKKADTTADKAEKKADKADDKAKKATDKGKKAKKLLGQ